MDVLELLDALEVEIRALRTERAKLTAAFEVAQQQLRSLLVEGCQPAAGVKAPKSRVKARKARAKTKARAKPGTSKTEVTRKSPAQGDAAQPEVKPADARPLADVRRWARRYRNCVPGPAVTLAHSRMRRLIMDSAHRSSTPKVPVFGRVVGSDVSWITTCASISYKSAR